MKKLITTLFIITVLITGGIYSSFAQEATSTEVWTLQETSGSRSWGSITSSADGSKLAASHTSPGYIYISTDSGDTWAPNLSAGEKYWGDITISSDGEKIAVFGREITGLPNAYIYTSINGGDTWSRSDNGPVFSGPPGFITSSGDTLVAVHLYQSNVYVYISHDWGISWATSSIESVGFRFVATSLDGAKIFSTVREGGIYISEDGGQNWHTSTSSQIGAWMGIDSSENGQILVARTDNLIYISEDGGETWATSTSAGERFWNSVQISDDGSKLLAIGGDHIYTSIDGGETWATSTEALGAKSWTSLTVSSDGSKLAAVNSSGYIYTNSPLLPPNSSLGSIGAISSTSLEFNFSVDRSHSKRGVEYCSTGISSTPCNSFTEYVEEEGTFSPGSATLVATDLTPKTYYHYRFYSENEAGRKYSDTYTILLDYREWNNFGIPEGEGETTYYTSLSSSSDGSSVLVTGIGYVKISKDGGETWYELYEELGGNTWLSSGSSPDGMKMYVYGYNYFYTSEDGGISWERQEDCPTGPDSMAHSEDLTRLIANDSWKLYISDDSGETWRISLEESDLEDTTSSLDGMRLAAVESPGYIYTSIDGGATWTERIGPGSKNWSSITYSGDGLKLVATENDVYDDGGYVHISNDGGETWTRKLGAQIWQFTASSADGKVLAAATGDFFSDSEGYIYTSIDGGETWTKDLSAGAKVWSSLSVSADGTTIFAGASDDVYYSQNLFPEAQNVNISRSLE